MPARSASTRRAVTWPKMPFTVFMPPSEYTPPSSIRRMVFSNGFCSGRRELLDPATRSYLSSVLLIHAQSETQTAVFRYAPRGSFFRRAAAFLRRFSGRGFRLAPVPHLLRHGF